MEGLLQRTLPPEELAAHVVTVELTGSYDIDELSDRLAALGYTRCQQVEGVGQFALRGGIPDVFSPGWTCRWCWCAPTRGSVSAWPPT